MSHFTRNPVHSRTAQALVQLTLLAALGGCGLVPKQPITQQPMTARAAGAAAAQAPGSIYNPGYAGRPLFEDQRPRNVGDILTIVIAENINATKSSGASANRSGSTQLRRADRGLSRRPVRQGQPERERRATSLPATGGANASNTFNGTITVTVTGVLPNGNLIVSGEKQMLINQGNEFVRFSGVVNPNTISSLNAVYSTQVADAKIEYSAKGYIDEAENMGWLQRFFLNVSPW